MRRNIFIFILLAGILSALAACSNAASPTAAKKTLETVNAEVTQILAQARPLMVELSQIPAAHGTDRAACEQAMAEKFKTNPAFTAFGAASLDGTLFCLTSPQTTPANITDRAYFQRAIAAKNFSVGDYQIGKVTNKKSVGIGYPVLDASGNVQGIVLAPLDLDWLNTRFADLQLEQGVHALLVDSQGTVLASNINPQEWVGKSIADSALGQAMLTQKDGAGEFAGPDNVTRIYAFSTPLGSDKNWYEAVGLPK